MDSTIISNLFEFWTFVGEKSGRLIDGEGYKSVNLLNSDWPNRIFDLNPCKVNIPVLLNLIKINHLPNLITAPNSHLELKGLENSGIQLFFQQKGMAINLERKFEPPRDERFFSLINSEDESIVFSKIASESFGYRVDPQIVHSLIKCPDKIKLFVGASNDTNLCSGLLFYDSNDNAGLHMIGTVPNERGKGLGERMTKKLIFEAQKDGRKQCVLHASKAGEKIYTKLGFKSHDDINTYIVQ